MSSDIKFHEIPSSVSCGVTFRWTDRQTDIGI